MLITIKNRTTCASALFACVLLLSFIAGCSKATLRPQTVANNDDYTIYSLVLDTYLNGEKHIYFVEPETTLRELRSFNFKDPRYHLLDTITEKHIDQADWKTFLNEINVDEIPSSTLALTEFRSKEYKVLPARRFKNRHNRKNLNYEPYDAVILFSPIILSGDGSKAVCSVMSYSNPGGSGTNIYFFEKIDKTWKIVDRILLGIS